MEDLEYKIGRLKINPKEIKFMGSNPYDAGHKFVVEVLDDSALIYIAPADGHSEVVSRFNLKNRFFIGGGSCYTNSGKELVLDDRSGTYNGAIPREVAQKFAELIIPELKMVGVETNGIAVNPDESFLGDFWKRRGFCSK